MPICQFSHRFANLPDPADTTQNPAHTHHPEPREGTSGPHTLNVFFTVKIFSPFFNCPKTHIPFARCALGRLKRWSRLGEGGEFSYCRKPVQTGFSCSKLVQTGFVEKAGFASVCLALECLHLPVFIGHKPATTGLFFQQVHNPRYRHVTPVVRWPLEPETAGPHD